jgi:hypothetical protein
MPDFRRTKELFEQQGLTELWNKRPKQLELLDDELFEVKVISPDTKAFYQLSDLPVGYRKLGEDRKYPIRQVLQIYRIKRVDGTEWLKSRGRIVGLDKLGNEVEHSFVDPEMFYKPVTRYEFRKSDSKMNTVLQREYAWKLALTHTTIDTQSIRYHLMKRTLKTFTSKGQFNPHPLLPWLYTQKGQAIGLDR